MADSLRRMRAGCVLGLAAAVLWGLPGCSDSNRAGSTGTTETAPPTSPTTEPEPTGPSTFTLGPIEVVSVDAPAEFPDWARAAVQTLLDGYLAGAVLRPLRSGEPAGSLGNIFGSPAYERINGPDRAALVDEGLSKADHVKVETATAAITAMAGLSVVAAGVTLILTARVAGTPVKIERTGELQLTTDGSRWTITGYGIRVSRHTPDGGEVTTTVAGRP